jgi:hypothetical protein
VSGSGEIAIASKFSGDSKGEGAADGGAATGGVAIGGAAVTSGTVTGATVLNEGAELGGSTALGAALIGGAADAGEPPSAGVGISGEAEGAPGGAANISFARRPRSMVIETGSGSGNVGDPGTRAPASATPGVDPAPEGSEGVSPGFGS